MSAKLRVGVLAETTRLPERSGHGKVWAHALAGLRERVRLEVVERERAGRRRLRGPDVWLADGQAEPFDAPGPHVVQLHEAPWEDPVQLATLDPRFVEALATRGRAHTARATRILTAARSAAREIAAVYGIAPDRIDVVPHGVDLDVFRPGAAGAGEHPYVLTVASVHPRKNLDAVRGAVACIARDGFPHRLVLVARPAPDREDQADLERRALAELPGAPGRVVAVHEPGEAELAALMAGAAALVQPSLGEGFGLPVLEAMACGTPVVVSDRGALPELAGDAGVVVEPTAQAVADGLRAVLGDPARAAELGAVARARAEGFGWGRTADGWAASLERAAAER